MHFWHYTIGYNYNYWPPYIWCFMMYRHILDRVVTVSVTYRLPICNCSRSYCCIVSIVSEYWIWSTLFYTAPWAWAYSTLHPFMVVNEYRLRLGRFKAGRPMCDAAWCAPCTWALLRRLCASWGAITNVWLLTFTFCLPRNKTTFNSLR